MLAGKKCSVLLLISLIYSGIALGGEPIVGDKYAAGALRGVTLGSGGHPLPHAQVTVHSVTEGSDLTVVSDGNGAFAVASLKPGQYQVSAKAQGCATSAAAAVVVTNRQTAQIDLSLARNDASNSGAQDPGMSPAVVKALEAMQKRIDELEAELKNRDTQARPEVAAAEVPAKAADQPQRTLLATIAKDPSAIPIVPGTLARPEEDRTIASNATPQNAPGPPAADVSSTPQNQAPAAPAVDLQTPFADFDWTWLNGNSRQHDSPLDSKYFSGEFRADTFYGEDFNQPKDHSMGGSSEVFRNGEVQLEDLSIGGDFHAGNMRGRVLALFGMFSATTVRNDASPGVGQWDVRAAYKYISEAYGGYHFNVNHGLNVDAGIFVSYVGLFSYHNFDNWAYQPSYVSSNTPWFFNGVRIQWFPTNHLKIEPWFINGWQSYNKYNGHPGLGGQLKWTPKPWLNVIANQYGVGNDNIGLPNRGRYHTDDSIEIKYFDKPVSGNGIDKMAFTFTGDAGCETGEGVTCHGGKGGPKQSFLGYMAYNRWWWHKDLLAFTLGGGQINNPGRYLTLVLPINGADAISGTPYFPAYPGAPFKAYDGTATLDYMPSQFVTFRLEFGYRHANVPYWSGRGGITPPGGNNGSPADFVCSSGASSGQTILAAAEAACGGGRSSVWFPDLREGQALLSLSIMVKL
jgi:hypothetical protein